MISLGLILLASTSCSTKQKVSELPAGANKAALSSAKPKPKLKVATRPSFSDTAGRTTLVGGPGSTSSAISNVKPKALVVAPPKPTAVPRTVLADVPTPKPVVDKPLVEKAAVERKPIKTRSENFDLASGETDLAALQYKYHVVVGSFKDKTNAVALQTALIAEGENGAIVVVNHQEMFRVIIGSFDSYKEAHTRISKMGDRFIDAWVLAQTK